jgi:chaperone modulatory protein CbpM
MLNSLCEHEAAMDATSRSQLVLSIDDLASAVGISRARLIRLVETGIIETVEPHTLEFSATTAARLSRMLRLRSDLGVNFVGAAIILDLVDRLERMRLVRGRI